MTKKIKRASCLCLTAVMGISLAASGAFAFADGKNGKTAGTRYESVAFEDVTGKVDLSGVAMQNFSSQVIENAGLKVKNETKTVIVRLEGDSIIESVPEDTEVGDYLNTYTGGRALKKIEREQTNFLNSLSSLGVKYEVVYHYTNVINAVAIKVNTQYLTKIKKLDNVKYTSVSQTFAYPEAVESSSSDTSGITTNPSNVYETGIYDSSKWVGEGYDGSGMTVAVLDTGLDYTHTAFQNMPETVAFTKDYIKNIDASKLAATQLSAVNGVSLSGEDVYVNAKVPFAYDYADGDNDVYPSYSQHGVHVAGIVAGEADRYTNSEGEWVMNGNEYIPFRGVAPKAQLVICKVFTDDFESKDLGGATSESIIAALEDCVTLGVDVINMSLGTSAGFGTVAIEGDDEGAALNEVYGSVRNKGINLICAASNDFSSGSGSAFGTNLASNPDSGTVGSPSTCTGAVSVASINGQQAPYMLANGKSIIYYQDSSDANGVRNNFIEQMLGSANSKTFRYIALNGTGQAGNYTPEIKEKLKNKQPDEKIIVVVRRGGNTFQNKITIAEEMGADAIIVRNNVAGQIGMSLGDLEDPIPAVSVTMDAGELLCYEENGKWISEGEIELNKSYLAGPFMNDYSSWGTTPDLQIKPEITSHGGEITSAVSGVDAYTEMSGTSMASPNLAGFVALLRGKIHREHPEWTAQALTARVNQILLSTAVTVFDQDGKPYSPRKQGAGLATLDHVFTTSAFLYTGEGANKEVDGRPKYELGDDAAKKGVYNITFYVANSGDTPLRFKPDTLFMTESLSSDGLAVAEKAHMLTDVKPVWKVNGTTLADDGEIEVPSGAGVDANGANTSDFKIEVTLTLSDAEKNYIDKSFVNGMFVEGFLRLLSTDEKQCGLTLPFMGFYGDWTAAPMLDYSVFEVAEFEKDPNYTDETRPSEQIWATQAYATYNNDRYSVPMGSYAYVQNENADQIYAEEEHSAISCFDIFNAAYGQESYTNYVTANGIRALYAGLLRNAELVTYDLYDDITGELILQDRDYRLGKAHASGGNTVPANVELDLYPSDLGLVNNGKYRLNFHFYFKAEDEKNPAKQTDDNTFSMTFYVDYEAPILADSRIRYYDYKDNNRDKQRVYLDLDIYDNHYPQAVILCYTDREGNTDNLKLATDYITPVYNPNKNDINTVSIEITEFYNEYRGKLYVQIDDYALNHSVYSINFVESQRNPLPDDFTVDGDTEITIGVNETYKVALNYEGEANLSNFTWRSSSERYVRVNNGEIFGVSPGTAYVTVTSKRGSQRITVHVVESSSTITSLPSLSFGSIVNSTDGLQQATGTVNVNAGQNFRLTVQADPWYFPIETLKFNWSSSDENIATVDQNGNVRTLDKKGMVNIRAVIDGKNYGPVVTLNVQDPFTVKGGTLTDYHGTGGTVYLPDDENITSIGTQAFRDNDNIRVLVISKTVTQISERAFENCTALEEIYFIQQTPLAIPNANLSLILRDAFIGCTKLRKVDLSNTKTITLDARVFRGCTSLEEVVAMNHIGTMNAMAFAGCTSLKEADITGLHNSGREIFAGCTALETVKTAYYTSLGQGIFRGCTALESVIINTPTVMAEAFSGCGNLKTVEFGGAGAEARLTSFNIGTRAFAECINLISVDFNGKNVGNIGDYAFTGCSRLAQISLPEGVNLGIGVFEGTQVNDYADDVFGGAIYKGTTLMSAPASIPADFKIREGTTEIADYAFMNSRFASGYTLEIPATVTRIGTGAFMRSNLQAVTLPEGLASIPAYAFSGTSLGSITVPASVTSIGAYAFSYGSRLNGVSFAQRQTALELGEGAFTGCTSLEEIALPALVASDGKVVLAYSAFAGCYALTSVDLSNVTEIGAGAFAGCRSIAEIDLKNVTVIGYGAFGGIVSGESTVNCSSLSSVTGLEKVTHIGEAAFNGAPLENINISSATEIGATAFYGSAVSSVTIGANLKTLGGGAFANSANLTAFTVNANNANFFAEDGVLYRIISGTKENGTYELCAYPTAKRAAGLGKVYNVKDGAVTVSAYAMAFLAKDTVSEVVLPYSVKTLGNAAFYSSGITSYVFNSIQAPVLLTETYDVSEYISSYRFGYALNFEDGFVTHIPITGNAVESQLKISYPENGSGYDNYVYENYFGQKVTLGELMDDRTRSLKAQIEGFESAQTVAGWNSLEVNEQNTAMVAAFSDRVKAAHAEYNNITSQTQLDYLGSQNIQKLFDIESALKSVKARFGIALTVSSLRVSPDSTHKTEYKVGDKFDPTGLKIIVTYDDYSTEEADISKVTFDNIDEELTVLNRYVRARYAGRMVQIAITVTEDGGEEKPEPPKKGCGSYAENAVICAVALGVTLCAYATVAVVKKLSRKEEDK